ncbi:hypothetical protein Q5L94_12185 [Idiomarina sp. Sol25]|uniref:hypothetical protein n=1 Tax=Idiomarina sp. Sol25 TaxID=3064000 RepID=UPI00294ADD38|nr:hypothetical protein [Idiomarina sp. Sol25]MDV6328819.1 hypothetical protein [Idiomarina sp. Sol25]
MIDTFELSKFNRFTKVAINISSWLLFFVAVSNIFGKVQEQYGYLDPIKFLSSSKLSYIFNLDNSLNTNLSTVALILLSLFICWAIKLAFIRAILWEIRDAHLKNEGVLNPSSSNNPSKNHLKQSFFRSTFLYHFTGLLSNIVLASTIYIFTSNLTDAYLLLSDWLVLVVTLFVILCIQFPAARSILTTSVLVLESRNVPISEDNLKVAYKTIIEEIYRL